MKLYYYEKIKKHKSTDTDVFILTSVGAFCKEYSLAQYTGKVLRTSFGKPYLENNFLYVGVTHTENIIIVCVSKENFGIDCENIDRTIKRADSVMNRFFTENERRSVYEKENKDAAFIDTWVKKEAYVKYTGLGLSGLTDCDTTSLSGFTKIPNDKNLIIYIYKEQNYE